MSINSLGMVLAITALILAIVFAAIGHLSIVVAGFVILLAASILTAGPLR